MRLSRYYLLLIACVLGMSVESVESAHSDGNSASAPPQLVRRRKSDSIVHHEPLITENPPDRSNDHIVYDEEYDDEDSEEDSNDEKDSFDDSTVTILPPNHELHAILLNAQKDAEELLSIPNFPIPMTEQFASLANSYFTLDNYNLFVFFLKSFRFENLEDPKTLWNLLHLCRNNSKYFDVIMITQISCIFINIRSFWHEMLHIDQVQSDTDDRSQCKSLHPSFHWAFQHFRKILNDENVHCGYYASFCIMNLIVDAKDPYPKSLVKAILNYPDIELNVSLEGNCIALYTMGLPGLPEYYPNLILSHPRLDVNHIVDATERIHGHIICHVPAMPLIMHSFIYLNMRALKVLWFNPNLKVTPMIYPFFQLLRLAFMVFFFHFWDSSNSDWRHVN